MAKINETPWQRFSRDARRLDFPEDDERLRGAFLVAEERTVTADHVVSFDGTAYEVPRALRPGEKATVYRRLLEGTLAILYKGRLVELHPVDLAANARSGRGRCAAHGEVSSPPPRTAADMAFERDYGTVTDPDGGFPEPDAKEENPWT